MRRRTKEALYDPELGRYLRRLCRSNGSLVPDRVPDSSLAGLFLFGMFGAREDAALEATMATVEEQLWCADGVGGVARYEDDDYHRACACSRGVPGNPWILCTLWLADWYLERKQWPRDLQRAQDMLLWVTERALPSGVLAEQVHPKTGAPLSVSPLTWSHAEFVGTVHRFLDCLSRLHVGKKARVTTFVSPEPHPSNNGAVPSPVAKARRPLPVEGSVPRASDD
jgi:GH15 family glucan-1,4-alpha-glucosidase